MEKVWITVRVIGDDEDLNIFDRFDDIDVLYDFAEQISVSKTTLDKLSKEGFYAKRYGTTVRAYKY